jgi:hypothetical protein
MPTIDQREGYAIRIYRNDHAPAHVHVAKAGDSAVLEIAEAPVTVRVNYGMKPADLRRAARIVEENRDRYLADWRRIHG